MKKTVLTCLLGLGLAPAFASYTYYGPTQVSQGQFGPFVHCYGTNFQVCVQNNGPSPYPQSGDQVDLWSDGEYIGTFTVMKAEKSDPPTDKPDPKQPVEGFFELKANLDETP